MPSLRMVRSFRNNRHFIPEFDFGHITFYYVGTIQHYYLLIFRIYRLRFWSTHVNRFYWLNSLENRNAVLVNILLPLIKI